MQNFRVNDYLSLKLEDGHTIIYVGKKRFLQCKYLMLNIKINEIQTLDEIESIDEAAEKLDKSQEGIGPKKAKLLIDTYRTPHRVVKAIKHTEIVYTRNGNPKGINGPLSKLSGFGWKFVQKNKKILFGKRATT